MGSCHTDSQGRFELHNVCRLDTIRVRAIGEGFLNREVYLDPDDPERPITLVVEERCHFSVKLNQPSSVHSFRMLDNLGEVLEIHHFGAIGGGKRTRTFKLQDGKSPVLSVSDRACSLELIGETNRIEPIRLSPGENTVLEF